MRPLLSVVLIAVCGVAGIVKIIAARETVYEQSGAGSSAAQLRGRRARDA